MTKIRMCKSKIDKFNAIVVKVTMGRPIINSILTVFVPTMLLVNISFTARLPKHHKVLKWSTRSKRSIRFQRSLSLSVSISVFLSVFVFAIKFKSLLVPKIPSKLEVAPPPKCGLGEWVIPLRLLRLLEHLAVLTRPSVMEVSP